MRKGSSDTIRNGRAQKMSFLFELRRRYIKVLLIPKPHKFKKRHNLRRHIFFPPIHVHNSPTLTGKISTIKLKLGLVEDIRTHLVGNIVSLQRGRAGLLLNFVLY